MTTLFLLSWITVRTGEEETYSWEYDLAYIGRDATMMKRFGKELVMTSRRDLCGRRAIRR